MTEDDKETVRAIHLLVPFGETVEWDEGVKVVRARNGKVLLALPPKLFPELEKGETLSLNERER